MASCSYHSPHFSEDAAWLPAWLQPHQLPAFGDRTKDELMLSQSACKDSTYIQGAQDGPLFTAGNAGYSGCNLFLSGDDTSLTGSTPSSENAFRLHLHLSSSVDNLQSSSSQLKENTQTRECEPTKAPSTRSFSEAQLASDSTSHQSKMEGAMHSPDMPPIVHKQRESHRSSSEPLGNRKELQEKLDPGELQHADLNNAIELSISASEALVISEILSTSLQSESLPIRATALEIALRVKHAWIQYHFDTSNDDSVLSSDAMDETDQLFDLDEAIMADAFDDAGLSVTQVVASPGNSLCNRKSSCNVDGSDERRQQNQCSIYSDDITAPISGNNLERKEKTKCKKIMTPDIEGIIYQNHDASPVENRNTLTTVQVNFKGDMGTLQDGAVAKHADAHINNGIQKYFVEETSFISESVDVASQRTVEQRAEGLEIIASSSIPLPELSRCTNLGNKISTSEMLVLSADFKSSSLSLEDPLCSVVPCSIASENQPFNLKEDVRHGRKNMNLSGLGLQNLDEMAPTEVADVILPSKPLGLEKQSDFSKVNAEGYGAPSCMHFSSLKPYSMVVSDQNIANETVFQNKLTSLNRYSNLMHVFPTEVDINYSMSEKHGSPKIPSNPIGKDENIAGLCKSHTLGSNEHFKVIGPSVINEKLHEPSATRESKDDDIELPVHKNEEKHSPSKINNKAGSHFQTCNMLSERDDVNTSLKRASVTRKRKHKSKCSTKVATCSDRTTIPLHVPPRSSLHLFHQDNRDLPNKRVRFSEAKFNSSVNKSGQKMRFGYGSYGACYKTSERMKESSLPHKPDSRKKRISYLTSCSSKDEKEMLFHGLVFLLTGFSSRKGKELEALIRKHGGFVLSTIPSYWPEVRGKRRIQCMSWKVPIILSPEKVQSTKFLFGCAINAWMLNANWLFDSLQANLVLPPGKYMTRLIHASERNCLKIGEPLCLNSPAFIFDKIGVMPYGKASFCTKFSKILKYGGGQLFKSLEQLVHSLKNGKISVGAILVEDEGSVPRHLKHCALEHDLQTMPASWIINSLFSGKLLPFKKDRCAPLYRIKKPLFCQAEAFDMSEEI